MNPCRPLVCTSFSGYSISPVYPRVLAPTLLVCNKQRHFPLPMCCESHSNLPTGNEILSYPVSRDRDKIRSPARTRQSHDESDDRSRLINRAIVRTSSLRILKNINELHGPHRYSKTSKWRKRERTTGFPIKVARYDETHGRLTYDEV